VDISNLGREVVTWQLGLINALLEGRVKSRKANMGKTIFESSAPFFTLQRKKKHILVCICMKNVSGNVI